MACHSKLEVILEGERRMVPGVGLEPTRSYLQGILSPSCIPFHHPGNVKRYY